MGRSESGMTGRMVPVATPPPGEEETGSVFKALVAQGQAFFGFICLFFPDGSLVKDSMGRAGDAGCTGLIPEPGGSPGEGYGTPLQCSCLEKPVDRGAWQTTVCGVSKSWT